MHTSRFTLAGLLAAGLLIVASGAKADNGRCNNETFKGAYGFTLTGWRIPDPAAPVHLPRAGVGRLAADGKGNLSGTETKSKNGIILPVTFVGTYSVNNDCTGSAHMVVDDPDEHNRSFNFTLVDNGAQVMAIQTDPGRATTVLATQIRGVN